MLLSGCHLGPVSSTPRLVWIDINKASKARHSWRALPLLERQIEQVEVTSVAPKAFDRAHGELGTLVLRGDNTLEIQKRRKEANESIARQLSAVEAELLTLAEEHVSVNKPAIYAIYEKELVTLRAQQKIAISVQAREIAELYAEKIFQLELDRTRLMILADRNSPPVDVKDKLAQVAMNLVKINDLMNATLVEFIAKQAKLTNEAKNHANKQAEQQYQTELEKELALARKQAVTQSLTGIDSSSYFYVGSKTIPSANLNIEAIAPLLEYKELAPTIEKNLRISKEIWRSLTLEQTREAANQWTKRHGYILATSPDGAEDMTEEFINQWTF
jgi:hypothetical protein